MTPTEQAVAAIEQEMSIAQSTDASLAWCRCSDIATVLSALKAAQEDAARLRKTQRAAYQAWQSLCSTHGWEPNHIVQLAALAAARTQGA